MIRIYIILFSLLFITGCGHNIICTDKGTGMLFKIPLPDGSSLLQMKIGNIESTRTILRGNATCDILTSTGGSIINQAGTTSRMLVRTGTQLNQGYIKDILTSKDLSNETKLALINFLAEQVNPQTTPVTIKSVGTAGSTDKQSLKVEAIKDELIDKTNDTIKTITPIITDSTIKTANKLTNTVNQAYKTISIDYQSQKLIANILIGLLCLIVALTLILIIIKTIIK